MPVAAAGITGAAAIGGSILSNRSSEKAAKRSIAFQREMAKNAHQYEVEDLRKAGLNPILSAGGPGASASGGAMPNIRPVVPSELVATAVAAKKAAQEIKNLESAENLIRQQTQETAARTDKTYWEAKAAKYAVPAARAEGQFWEAPSGSIMKWVEKLGIDANTAKYILQGRSRGK